MIRLAAILALSISALAFEVRAEDLCKVLAHPQDFAGKSLTIRASVKPTMHGTYLNQSGCTDSLLIVLPEEIPNYRGSVLTVKDTHFDDFQKARFDHRPDALVFSATFSGQLEYAKRGKFGYYRNHRARLVLRAVEAETGNH
jgi:hypothetical protein